MALNLHSGHLHLAARQLPNPPSDCTPLETVLTLPLYEAQLSRMGGKLTIPVLPESLTLLTHMVQQPHPNLQEIVRSKRVDRRHSVHLNPIGVLPTLLIDRAHRSVGFRRGKPFAVS